MRTDSSPPIGSAHDRALRAIVLSLDGLVVLASMGAAFALHTGLRRVPALQAYLELRALPTFEQYALLLYLTLPLFLGLFLLFGMQKSLEQAWSRARLLLALTKVHFAVLTGLSVVSFLTQTVINRSMLLLFLGCTFVLQYAARELLGGWQRFQHAQGHARARILLVGEPGPGMQAFIESCQQQPYPPEIVGRLSRTEPQSVIIGARGSALRTLVPQRGSLQELAQILHHEPIDRVLFFPPMPASTEVGEALRLCETLGVPAGVAVDLTPYALAAPRIEFHLGMPFVEFELAPRAPGPLAVKHALDVIVAAALVILLSPVLLAVALAILLTMGRPILFVQERAGRRGRSFRMLKFRTMVSGAEAMQGGLREQNIMGGPVFKIRNDPRVTRLGRFLRVSSLDELPQLFNVLLGQMSLVGPRPLPRTEQQQIFGWHRRRLSMKPGITGLWQVSGRNEIAFDQWMRLDLEYVDNWSLSQDLRILLRTIPALLHRRGAH